MNELKGAMKNAVDNFNWGDVYMFMNLVGWTWFSSPAPPTVAKLKEAAWELFDHFGPDDTAIESGGLRVSKSNGGIEIEFIAVSSYGHA